MESTSEGRNSDSVVDTDRYSGLSAQVDSQTNVDSDRAVPDENRADIGDDNSISNQQRAARHCDVEETENDSDTDDVIAAELHRRRIHCSSSQERHALDLLLEGVDLMTDDPVKMDVWKWAERELLYLTQSDEGQLYVPDAQVESMGVNVDNAIQFKKVVEEIIESLYEQRCADALSSLRGWRKAFRESEKEIQRCMFDLADEVELLKALFFKWDLWLVAHEFLL